MWMKTRLPIYEPVASWWDYGYWISIIGNKTSLADNSTINATQIGKIGLALMAPPQVGAEIFTKDFRTKYVLAIMPYIATPLSAGYLLVHEYPPGGDFLKSYWMARIALENVGDAAKILGATSTNFEDFFYTKVMGRVIDLTDLPTSFTLTLDSSISRLILSPFFTRRSSFLRSLKLKPSFTSSSTSGNSSKASLGIERSTMKAKR